MGNGNWGDYNSSYCEEKKVGHRGDKEIRCGPGNTRARGNTPEDTYVLLKYWN